MGDPREDEHLIVDLYFQDESLSELFDGEGKLYRVLALYDGLLAEDYWPLFLAWLQAALLEHGWEPDVVLPPIPPGLRKLSEPLRTFIELFDIDSDLVTAAASFSDPIQQESNEDLTHALESMPAAQQADFLRRMVLGEPPLVIISELRGQLRKSARSAKSSIAAPLPPPASAGVLFAKAQRIQLDRERKASEREAALERRRLDEIEREEGRLWRRVDELILEKTVATYDEAVGILKNLRNLALHKKRGAEFVRRVEAILEKHPRLSGLRRRIEDAKLLEESKSG